MPRNSPVPFATALAVVLALTAGAVPAQKTRIVCWKDKAGKVIGCGDRVPEEYQDAAIREIDAKTGLTRKTTGTAEEEARRAAEAEELKKRKEAEKRRLAEQKRKDMALLNTYVNEAEIDQRRDRELQEVDRVLGQFRDLHKNAVARHAAVTQRAAAAEQAGKPSDALKNEAARAAAEKSRIEQSMAVREKEKESIRARYAETKRRYAELKGGGTQAAAPPAKK